MVRGGKFRLSFLVFFILLIASFSVFADSHNLTEADSSTLPPTGFNQARSYQWLYSELTNMSVDVDIRALTTIALIQGNVGTMSGLIEELKNAEDTTQHCWPQGGCKTKETALATLALALAGQNVSSEVAWLKDARVPGLAGGSGTTGWLIVIKADNNGSCSFVYPGVVGNRTFRLDNDRIRGPGPTNQFTSGQYYISLNELSTSLATSGVRPQISMSCDPNLLNVITTLVYKPNANTFFIQRSDPGPNLDFRLANACFGITDSAGSCNYESTAYATWALLEIGQMINDLDLTLEGIGTHMYLETQALNRRTEPVSLGMLNRILIRAGSAAPSFISDLVILQRVTDGSWSGDIAATSIASFGLTGSDQGDPVGRGLAYLIGAADNDGSWDADMWRTSWALIALHGGELSRVLVSSQQSGTGNVEICGNGIDDDLDGVNDCGASECSSSPLCQCQNNLRDGNELGVDCGGSCPVACLEDQDQPQPFEQRPEPEPVIDEPFEEPEEEGGSLWWLWVLIILIIIGSGGLFYVKYVKTGKVDLKNLFKKKPKGPTFDQFKREMEFRPVQQTPQRPQSNPLQGRPMQPRPSARPPSKPPSDDELERSLKEAQKILKG